MAPQTTWSHWEVIMFSHVKAEGDQMYQGWEWGAPTEDWQPLSAHLGRMPLTLFLCVSQRNAFRLWCTADMLCPEASVQTDPPPWLQSSRAFLSRQRYAAPQLSPHLFSLPTWWLWTPQPENLGSQGTLHESRPAAFPVWWFRASIGRGERSAAGRQ